MGNVPFSTSSANSKAAAKDMELMIAVIERLFKANNLATKSWKGLYGAIGKDVGIVQSFTNAFLELADKSNKTKTSISTLFKKIEETAATAGKSKPIITNVFDKSTEAIYKEIAALDKLMAKREALSKFGKAFLSEPSRPHPPPTVGKPPRPPGWHLKNTGKIATLDETAKLMQSVRSTPPDKLVKPGYTSPSIIKGSKVSEITSNIENMAELKKEISSSKFKSYPLSPTAANLMPFQGKLPSGYVGKLAGQFDEYAPNRKQVYGQENLSRFKIQTPNIKAGRVSSTIAFLEANKISDKRQLIPKQPIGLSVGMPSATHLMPKQGRNPYGYVEKMVAELESKEGKSKLSWFQRKTAKTPKNKFNEKYEPKKSSLLGGIKGVGLGTGITPFVKGKIESIKGFASRKGITGGGKAQTLGALAGLGAVGTLKTAKFAGKTAGKVAVGGAKLVGKGVLAVSKMGASLAKKGVQKSLGMFNTMGKVLKSGLVAGAAGALVGLFNSMSPMGAIGSTMSKAFGSLSSVMTAQLAPVLAKLTTTILTPANIKLFQDLGVAFIPLVSSVADLLNSILSGGAFENIVTGVITVLGSLFDIFNDPNLQASLGILISSLSDLAINFFSFLADMMPSLTPILTAVAGLFGTIANIFSDPAFQEALGGFISTLASLIGNLVNIASELLTDLQPYFVIFLDLLSQMLGLFNDPAVKDAIKLVVENLVIMAVDFIEALSLILPVLLPLLIPLLTWLTDIGVFVSNIIVGLASVISTNRDAIFSVFNGIISFINGIINKVNSVFGTDFPTIPLAGSHNTGETTPAAGYGSNASGGGQAPPVLSSQGIITGTGIAKVHAGEMVVKDSLIRDVIREAMNITNNFYGQVGPNERREFTRTMKEIWGED